MEDSRPNLEQTQTKNDQNQPNLPSSATEQNGESNPNPQQNNEESNDKKKAKPSKFMLELKKIDRKTESELHRWKIQLENTRSKNL